jgi:hypothetical protein
MFRIRTKHIARFSRCQQDLFEAVSPACHRLRDYQLFPAVGLDTCLSRSASERYCYLLGSRSVRVTALVRLIALSVYCAESLESCAESRGELVCRVVSLRGLPGRQDEQIVIDGQAREDHMHTQGALDRYRLGGRVCHRCTCDAPSMA